MIFTHNLVTDNARRQLGVNTKYRQKCTETFDRACFRKELGPYFCKNISERVELAFF